MGRGGDDGNGSQMQGRRMALGDGTLSGTDKTSQFILFFIPLNAAPRTSKAKTGGGEHCYKILILPPLRLIFTIFPLFSFFIIINIIIIVINIIIIIPLPLLNAEHQSILPITTLFCINHILTKEKQLANATKNAGQHDHMLCARDHFLVVKAHLRGEAT